MAIISADLSRSVPVGTTSLTGSLVQGVLLPRTSESGDVLAARDEKGSDRTPWCSSSCHCYPRCLETWIANQRDPCDLSRLPVKICRVVMSVAVLSRVVTMTAVAVRVQMRGARPVTSEDGVTRCVYLGNCPCR